MERNSAPLDSVSWAEKYRPSSARMVIGNEESVDIFYAWLSEWPGKKRGSKAACLLVGPPGVGKTTLARAAASDLHYHALEMNASDVRTQKAIDEALGPARTSLALDAFTGSSKGNLLLLDEVDGLFGREDRGGLGAVISLIDKSPIPIVLTANNTDDDRFADLLKACFSVEMREIRPRMLVPLLNHILSKEGKRLPIRKVKEIARQSRGDIRSAINDLQALTGLGSADVLNRRSKELDERHTIEEMFTPSAVARARRALNETEVPLYRDQLLLLIQDLLPYVYTTPSKLAAAYDSLSRADMGYGRIGAGRSRVMMPPPFNMPRRDRVPNWSLLPFVLNELATVGVQKADDEVNHALVVAPRLTLRVPERYQYRLWQLDRLCGRIARALHVSKRTARSDIVPTLVAILSEDAESGREIAVHLGLEEQDIAFLISESKTKIVPKGTEQVLEPSGFKLPYMGKDKFIQLMRAGLSYDRKAGGFAVRRLDRLDSVEEQVSQIIGKPVKFRGQEAPSEPAAASAIVKDCYIDGTKIHCAKCEFVEACPTHEIPTLTYCLCDKTYLEPGSYEEYASKRALTLKPTETPAATERVRAKRKPKR